jgi:hypothetical protein
LQNANPTIELQRATTTTQPPLLGDIATGSVRITSEIDCVPGTLGSVLECPDEVIFGIPIPIDGNSLVTSNPSGSIPIPTGPGESTLFLLTPQPIAVAGDEIEYADLSISVTNGGCSVQTTDEPPDDLDTFRVAQITVPRGQVTCGLAITYTAV